MTTPLPEPERSPSDRGGFALFLACATTAASLFASMIALRPPAPRGDDAPPTEFSAARAGRYLSALAGDGLPRPLGSKAHDACLERIVAAFRDVGAEVEIEEHRVAERDGFVAHLRNVVASLPGTVPHAAPVALVSHYDSVPAGPGAADDLHGVAVALEVARALRAGPPLRQGVVFLVTDGEEAGLRGARAHVRRHRVDPDVETGRTNTTPYHAVVNVEARGNAGPSVMFETGPGDAQAVAAWARHARRPVTSSLFPAIYRSGLIRNDTDFTAFRRADAPGLNFACIGRVQHYHTPLDTVANLDRGTLQHAGDQALAAVRGLAEASVGSGDSVWCDVLGVVVLRWPLWLTLAMSLVAVLLATIRWSQTVATPRELAVAAGAQVVALVLGSAGAWGAVKLLDALGAIPVEHVAAPGWAAAASAGTGVAFSWAWLVYASRWFGAEAAHAGTWTLWSLLGVVVAIALPEAAYLFVLPALVAGVVALVRPAPFAFLLPLAAAGVLWAPLWFLFGDALGAGRVGGVLLGCVAAVATTPAGAFLAIDSPRRGVASATAAVLALAGFAGAAIAPTSSEDLPRATTLVRVAEEGRKHAHVYVVSDDGEAPAVLREAFEFEQGPGRIVPWEDDVAPALEATPVTVPAPALEDVRSEFVDGVRRVRLRLVSRRGAAWTWLAIEPTADLRRIVVEGTVLGPDGLRDPGTGAHVVRCPTTPPEGLLLELDFSGREPADVFVADATPGLLPEDAPILAARPRDRVPRGEGDRTVALRKTRL